MAPLASPRAQSFSWSGHMVSKPSCPIVLYAYSLPQLSSCSHSLDRTFVLHKTCLLMPNTISPPSKQQLTMDCFIMQTIKTIAYYGLFHYVDNVVQPIYSFCIYSIQQVFFLYCTLELGLHAARVIFLITRRLTSVHRRGGRSHECRWASGSHQLGFLGEEEEEEGWHYS